MRFSRLIFLKERAQETGFFFIPKTFSEKRFQFCEFTIDKDF